MKAFELLYEDFSTDKVDTVKFLATQWADKHVQHIITEAAKKLGVTVKEITSKIQTDIDQIMEYKKIAPMLYSTMAENAIENSIFRLVQEHKITSEACPKFSPRKFFRLVDYIKAEHDAFFPLKDIIRHQSIKEAFIFVPSENHPEYNSVDTAAATKNGEFIFSVPFMQDLIEFAHIKGIKPKGKKYVSNGGDIPDEYEYIEFVIIHEFMHFTQADWDLSDYYYETLKDPKTNKHKIDPGKFQTITNWVGDFRNNYTLVKHGLTQLPIGLFSSAINYDKQQTFKQMLDIVVDEFNKLQPQQQQQLENMMNDAMDDHSQQDQQDQQDQQSGSSGSSGSSGGGSGSQKPSVGDIVKNKKTGKYGKVRETNEGKVIVEEMSKEDAEREIEERKSAGN